MFEGFTWRGFLQVVVPAVLAYFGGLFHGKNIE